MIMVLKYLFALHLFIHSFHFPNSEVGANQRQGKEEKGEEK